MAAGPLLARGRDGQSRESSAAAAVGFAERIVGVGLCEAPPPMLCSYDVLCSR